MFNLWQSILQALRLLASFDPEFWRIVGTSLKVSGIAALLAAALAVPLALLVRMVVERALARYRASAYFAGAGAAIASLSCAFKALTKSTLAGA